MTVSNPSLRIYKKPVLEPALHSAPPLLCQVSWPPSPSFPQSQSHRPTVNSLSFRTIVQIKSTGSSKDLNQTL
jgi:hypothetical protein